MMYQLTKESLGNHVIEDTNVGTTHSERDTQQYKEKETNAWGYQSSIDHKRKTE